MNFPALAAVVCALMFTVTLSAAPTNKIAARHSSGPQSWPAETLSGKIMTVDPSTGLVVVKTPDGVPFDFDITSHTRIDTSKGKVTLKDLQTDLNKGVSVKFVPEAKGDIAQSIQING